MVRYHTGRRTANGRYHGTSYSLGPVAFIGVVLFFLAIWALVFHTWVTLLLIGLFIALFLAMGKVKAETEAEEAQKRVQAKQAQHDAFMAESRRLHQKVNRPQD